MEMRLSHLSVQVLRRYVQNAILKHGWKVMHFLESKALRSCFRTVDLVGTGLAAVH